MAKVTIKPLRSFYHGDAVYTENKSAKVEADEADFFVKNGWAVEVKGKAKDDDPPIDPPAAGQGGNGQSDPPPETEDGE